MLSKITENATVHALGAFTHAQSLLFVHTLGSHGELFRPC